MATQVVPLQRVQVLALEFDEAGTGIAKTGGPLDMNLGSSKSLPPATRFWVLYPFAGQSEVTANLYPGTNNGVGGTGEGTTQLGWGGVLPHRPGLQPGLQTRQGQCRLAIC